METPCRSQNSQLRSNPPSIGDNWCRACGNAEVAYPSNYCNSASFQPEYPIAESACADIPGVVAVKGWCSNGNAYAGAAGCAGAGGTWTANPENYSGEIYSPAKGGMGVNSAGLKVLWRLPTRADFAQADIDRIRFIMPDMGAPYTAASNDWMTPLLSLNRGGAWSMSEAYGTLTGTVRNGIGGIRCVGR